MEQKRVVIEENFLLFGKVRFPHLPLGVAIALPCLMLYSQQTGKLTAMQ